MAAQPVPHQSTDKKRVKVYELRNNDWFDRGTGFCTAALHADGDQREPRVTVESEDPPHRTLLETRVAKGDSFHKQQGRSWCRTHKTLIVWTEPSNGVDMALSFQEAEGCTMIWRFINQIQTPGRYSNGADDSFSDDLAMDAPNPISLPPPTLGTLADIEGQLRMMSGTGNGRDALTKYVLNEDLIGKLCPLVSEAEDLESLNDLHRLCNIMKIVILLNDTSIIEHAVSDECVIGVVGALEYDPDFPSHKANHRQWLEDKSRYREVVKIEDAQIQKKIHQTYRLQYLKDVVLARILDDNTFSVLNSLIFFNQVDIVQHIQANSNFLVELFDIFKRVAEDPKRKKDAVLFIQQCCTVAKNLQPPARQTLYNNFIVHGLFSVINFGLRHTDTAVRVGATDIMVCMIDHDPQMIRQTIYRQLSESQPPLTDSLIDLLLIEVDLGVKSQVSDALKVLLDQGPPPQEQAFAKANGEYAARAQARLQAAADPQQERFLDSFYENSAPRLFQPLVALEGRTNMDFTVQQASMFTYLIEILCFFIRQHQHRSKHFVLDQHIVERIEQLLHSPEKFIKLVAIRFLRQLIGIQDDFYIKQIMSTNVIGTILDVLIVTMPRDNLLTSACLEFFEHIKKESIKDLIKHMVENFREQLEKLAYVPLFAFIVQRYDQTQGFTANVEQFMESEEDARRRRQGQVMNTRTGIMEHLMEQGDEEYWNTSDDEEDLQIRTGSRTLAANGSSPTTKLVDYASDEELDEHIEDGDLIPDSQIDEEKMDEDADEPKSAGSLPSPPERLSEKRRREEDEEDDISKLMANKRRNSSSASSNASSTSGFLGKKKRLASLRDAGGGPKKIAISLNPSLGADSDLPSTKEDGTS
ncbi:component of IIS longevity pathway SMK-1-domain-containing protein [Truncatella angustata]|uniref:Component of IIS longevity pathway SMK-1-domain-containing protein n=1 Tax=Truncatella angustata TaxID=152316 RepID=A0A9P9A1P2_9PEZI|nr:component of IIS longevity pathway SMK-1-domain-containing protein [Truncatella angustata]KAH6659776.1 component of IIS longevity pathway SMK-1-domain-containing protein [Truncatella angustata]